MENINNPCNPISVPVMRHFDDVDDLQKYGRDGIIKPGQEHLAIPFAEEICEILSRENKKAVLFICSSRIRAIQTAEIIVNKIKDITPETKCRISGEPGLRNIDQGSFNLPADYKSGDSFSGLDLANKVFNKEAFSENPNYLYKFGDPVLLENGAYKYPELENIFTQYGENYRDFLIRIYQMLLDTSEKVQKFEKNTSVIVITHAQLYQVLRDISAVGEMVMRNDLVLQPGDLPKVCWDLYQQRFKNEKPSYSLNPLSIEGLYDDSVLSFLRKEVEYLKSIK